MHVLQAIVEFADWSEIRWGLQRSPRFDAERKTLAAGEDDTPFWQVDKWHGHRRTRPDLQTLGSCAWNASALIREVWDAVAGLPVKQRDYDEAYRRYRIGAYGKFEDKGTSPDNFVEWCQKLRLFPDNTLYASVPLNKEAICEALEKGPLWTGQALHPGCKPGALSKFGEWDNSQLRNVNPNAGHAMACTGTNIRPTGARMILHDQSWGPLGYEDNGQTWEPIESFIYAALCEPILILPDLDALRTEPAPDWW